MVSKEEFKNFLKEMLQKDNNKEKLKYMKKNYDSVSLFLILTDIFSLILAVVFCMKGVYFAGVIFFVYSFISSIIWLSRNINFNKAIKYYKETYRDTVLEYLLKDYDYTFEKDGKISGKIFDDSQFAGNYDDYTGCDKLSINIANDDGSKSDNYLTLCDLEVTEEVEDSDGDERTVTVYKGVFGYIEFPFTFKCTLCINTKYNKKGSKLEKVVLEDINFGKKYGIYSSDQIEARYILTPVMMEKLLWIKSNFKNVFITLVDNKMYVGFPEKNMFELKTIEEDKAESMFVNFYDEINVIIKLVDEIKTNNKIFKI